MQKAEVEFPSPLGIDSEIDLLSRVPADSLGPIQSE
jgi:hypothetical protein